MSDVNESPDAAPDERIPSELLPAEEAPAALEGEVGLEVIEALAASDEPEPRVPLSAETPLPDGVTRIVRETARVLDAIDSLGEQLVCRLDALQTKFERELRAEATRERVIDRLHAELQEYKQDLLLKVQRPIFVDLIQLHDDIGKLIEARASGSGEGESGALQIGAFESIRTAIEDILYRQGVEPFVQEGDEFDARRQRAIATVPVTDPALNKKVAARLRKGFQAGEKLIRPEIVTVYTLRQGPHLADG